MDGQIQNGNATMDDREEMAIYCRCSAWWLLMSFVVVAAACYEQQFSAVMCSAVCMMCQLVACESL